MINKSVMIKDKERNKGKKKKLSTAEQEISKAYKKVTTAIVAGLEKFGEGLKKAAKALNRFGNKLNKHTGVHGMYGRKGKVNKIHVYNGAKALQVGPGRKARRTQNLITRPKTKQELEKVEK